MGILIYCGYCGDHFKSDYVNGERNVKCPECNKEYTVPTMEEK
jgi:DNA-directed RNA polymerase subunit RPC12/RpoP